MALCVAGVAFVIGGVAVIHWPSALVLFGLFLVAAGIVGTSDKSPEGKR